MKTHLITSCILMLFGHFSTLAQSPVRTDSMDVILIVHPEDHTMHEDDLNFKANTVLICKAIINLMDTVSISKLHIKLGSSNGSDNYFNETFLFDQTSNLPTGTAYERTQNVVCLTLGTLTGINTYFAELQIEYLNGQLSSPLNLTYSN